MNAVGRISLVSIFLEIKDDLERTMSRRTGSKDVAADLLHDLYLKCRRTDIEFPARTDARAYLVRMASNLAIDHVRVEGRRASILNTMAPIYQEGDTQAASPESFALADDKAAQIEAVLASLPGQTREMFILARLYGMTHKEVASRLGVSKSLVDKYMVMALIRCRDALDGLEALD